MLDTTVLRHRVRDAKRSMQPQMGASDDTTPGHAAAMSAAKLMVLGQTCDTIKAVGGYDIPIEAVEAILGVWE